MPFIPHTPESLLPRSDSKNPATTCKGITSSGRPCRRSLGQSSPTPHHRSARGEEEGVLAVLPAEGAAAFFCWQHRDQAVGLAADDGEVVRVPGRTSVDTLVDRLGIGEVGSGGGKGNRNARPARKGSLPKKWRDVPGPLIAVAGTEPLSEKRAGKASSGGRKPRRDPKIVFSLSCCTASVEPRDVLPPPVKRRPHQNRGSESSKTARIPPDLRSVATSRRHDHQALNPRPLPSPSPTPRPALAAKPSVPRNRPSLPRDPPSSSSSQTQDLLALIPPTLSPQTTSLLLAELAKPISDRDEEGYIYMFWLTPSASPAPSADAADALLHPSTRRPSPTGRRRPGVRIPGRDLTSPFATSSSPPSPNNNNNNNNSPSPRILLKIGRASNVQRRMNEWSRQCNHTLSLLRYYPYIPSPSPPSPSHPPSPPPPPHKVPHAHKIERLIHIELAALRAKRSCAACGREHREWFEVEGGGGRRGVGAVDEVVRRWVGWGVGGG